MAWARKAESSLKWATLNVICRSQWPRGLWGGSAAARLLRLRVRILPEAWMLVCCECCVLSRGLCVGSITRPEESYRVWCVWAWSRNLMNEEALAHGGLSSQIKIRKLNTTAYGLSWLFQVQQMQSCVQLMAVPVTLHIRLTRVSHNKLALSSLSWWLRLHVYGTVTRNAESSWNVMAHSDAGEGKWRGNWRMEWVASTLHTTTEHGVSSITTADAHTSADSSRLNWRPRRFKWNCPFRRKTKSGFYMCAITFQTQSTSCSSPPPRTSLSGAQPLW